MSDWFDFVSPLVRKTRARAEQVNGIFTEIKTALQQLPAKARIYENRVHYCGTTTGVAGAYIATPAHAVTLTDGACVSINVHATNAGASTINVYGLGALPIVDYAGNALTGGELIQGAFIDLKYKASSAHWRITNPLVDVGSVTVNNLASNSATDSTPGYLSAKVLPIGRLGTRTLNSGANESMQIKEKRSGHFTAVGTCHVGGLMTVSSASAAFPLYMPPTGTGDSAIQDGDTLELVDVGGALETNNVLIDGNGNNMKFMDAAAGATCNWIGPNYTRIRWTWSAADNRWNGVGA